MFTIATIIMICTITLLSFMVTKLLAILVGALLLYFCPILFLMAVIAGVIYFRFFRRGKAHVRNITGSFNRSSR